MTKPSIPKGTRDFMPAEVAKRNYIFDQIKKVFTTFGYVPIETPTMELLATLTGKYGEEGDKLLFKVLNNGDFLKDANKEALDNLQSQKLVSSISKRGLRYDLTVPLPGLSSCTKTKYLFLSKGIRYNRCGGLTVRSAADFRSFINVMSMWSVRIHSCTKLN